VECFVVDRDDGRGRDATAEVGRFGAGHRVAERAADREADAAEVDDRGADVEAVGDRGDAGVEDGVAGDPELTRRLVLPAEAEADHVADDRLAQRRRWRQGVAVTAIGGLPAASSVVVSHGFSPTALPPSRRAPAAVATTVPALGRSLRPRGVEVVVVLVVADQDGVEGPDLRRRDRRPRGLARRRSPTEVVLAAAGSKVGSVRIRQPSTSISRVGPPM
jgi:hypothetical protein